METEKWKLTLGKRNIDHRGGAGGRGGGRGSKEAVGTLLVFTA